ncbi:ATP-binding protein [Corallococcus sp. bb12-1]|uniref:ATP/GTP-binding protein n=1 Tax=Corallococcus sp. bb12-1 TaxID=2996784 RepID=UPI00226EABE6|nr:ATP-binding protein [Corallococcus sp. bb12-1]MCY1040108.1 ATP-binding protein [Corallococcus sp. bb12-1]
MKIALTGASSTGKTTLAKSLMKEIDFHRQVDDFLTTNARGLLERMGHKSMDSMQRDELLKFQREYLAHKQQMEEGRDRYLTDRSFVDVAAYWLRRDAIELDPEQQAEVVDVCRVAARRYDLHVYCPFGVVEFTSDGYRSEDLRHHREIGEQIASFLSEWGVRSITLDTADHEDRVARVLAEVRVLSAVQGLSDAADTLVHQ